MQFPGGLLKCPLRVRFVAKRALKVGIIGTVEMVALEYKGPAKSPESSSDPCLQAVSVPLVKTSAGVRPSVKGKSNYSPFLSLCMRSSWSIVRYSCRSREVS
jgi:hypothetical protein